MNISPDLREELRRASTEICNLVGTLPHDAPPHLGVIREDIQPNKISPAIDPRSNSPHHVIEDLEANRERSGCFDGLNQLGRILDILIGNVKGVRTISLILKQDPRESGPL
jgi:hypothetical protein